MPQQCSNSAPIVPKQCLNGAPTAPSSTGQAKRAPRVRVDADGREVALPALYTKTSLMLGLGETREEVRQAMRDMRR